MKRHSFAGLPRKRRNGAEGRLFPQPKMRDFNGRRARLDDVLGANFAVVGFGVDPMAGLSDQERDDLKRIGCNSVTVWPGGGRPQGIREIADRNRSTQELEDITGELGRWLSRHAGTKPVILILRPDRVVAAVCARKNMGPTLARLLGALHVTQSPDRLRETV